MSATKIEFEYKGKNYTLQYTADSLKKMEEQGVDFTALGKKILTAGETLFIGSFIANHPETPRSFAKEIYQEIKGEAEGGEALDDVLFEMFNEAIAEITQRSGNLGWKVTK